MSNFLYHNKYHRTIHHTLPTPGIPDSATDPIASKTDPFLGTFHNFIDVMNLDTIPIDVRYLLTFDDNYITNFNNLSVNTLDSIFLNLTASAYGNSYDWYRVRTLIQNLSSDYNLYPLFKDHVNSLSGEWSLGFNFYTNLSATSSRYESVYSLVNYNSASWPFIDTTLRTDLVQENTRSKNFAMVNISTPDTNIYWDLSSQQVAFVSLSANSVLKNILNPATKKKGGEYYLVIQQDGYGSKILTFESDYKFLCSDLAPVISQRFVSFSSKEVWTSVFYGSGCWVAVPYNSFKASKSRDGITWVGTPLPAVRNWRSIVFGVSAWVAVADSSSVGARSIDSGNLWSNTFLPTKRQWTSVGFGKNTFVAVASASDKGAKSIDFGKTWTEITLPYVLPWSSVKYGDGVWVAVAGGGVAGDTLTDLGAISYDNGNTWASFNLPSSRMWSDVAYGEDYWVAVAKNSNIVALSSRLEGDGWFDHVITNASVSGFSSVAHGNDTFVATSLEPSQAILYSTDSKIWTINNTVRKTLFDVNYGGSSLQGSFIAVGGDQGSTIFKSASSSYTNYKIDAIDTPITATGVLTAALGVTVIKFICDGINLYGIPSIYYVSRGPVWTYFAGPGIILVSNPTDLFVDEGLIPVGGVTTAGSVVVDEGFSDGGGILILSGTPIP